MDKQYENLMVGILDLLENGDAALDFETKPHMATVIRIISNIVRDELDAIDYVKSLAILEKYGVNLHDPTEE